MNGSGGGSTYFSGGQGGESVGTFGHGQFL